MFAAIFRTPLYVPNQFLRDTDHIILSGIYADLT